MIIFTATLSLMITVVVALAGVATSSGSIHSLGGHVVLSGHELSSPSAGKLFPSPIVVRIAGLLGFSMLLSACTWRLTSRGSQQVGCCGGSLPWCQVAVPSLEQAVKAIAEQARGEQRQQPRTVL
jgi:hypothetical protein